MKIEFPLFEKGVLDYVFLGNFKKESLHYKGEGVDIAFLYEKYIAGNKVNYMGVTILIYLEFASEPIEIKFGIAEEVISVIGDVGLEGIYKDMVGYVYTFYYQKVLGLSLFNTRNSGYLDSIILQTWLKRSFCTGSEWYDFYVDILSLSYRLNLQLRYSLLFVPLDTGEVMVILKLNFPVTKDELAILGYAEDIDLERLNKLTAFQKSFDGRVIRVSGSDYMAIKTKIYNWLSGLEGQYGVPYTQLVLEY